MPGHFWTGCCLCIDTHVYIHTLIDTHVYIHTHMLQKSSANSDKSQAVNNTLYSDAVQYTTRAMHKTSSYDRHNYVTALRQIPYVCNTYYVYVPCYAHHSRLAKPGADSGSVTQLVEVWQLPWSLLTWACVLLRYCLPLMLTACAATSPSEWNDICHDMSAAADSAS